MLTRNESGAEPHPGGGVAAGTGLFGGPGPPLVPRPEIFSRVRAGGAWAGRGRRRSYCPAVEERVMVEVVPEVEGSAAPTTTGAVTP